MKEKLNQIKEFVGKLSSKTIKLIIAGTIILVIGAIALAVVLNHKEYVPLYYNVTEEEAQQIVSKLQEEGVDYRYKGGGNIEVDQAVADQQRAKLALEGYPKSGFAYDTFINNSGGMTTDSDKKTYKQYELQDRIGATIRLIDGIKDAKVTIALGEEKKYALTKDDTEENQPSASVMVVMKDQGSPSPEQAAAIQRLVAAGVPELKTENVAVFDGSGIEVSIDSDDGALMNGKTSEELAQVVENQIAKKIMNVLNPIYGEGNVRVSAKATFNMEKLIRESITYHTPEKIDEEDKSGIISREEESRTTANGGATVGGVAGSDSNADIPQYNTITQGGDSNYTSTTAARDYLVNQIKEQGQIDPGVLSNLTLAITINGKNFGSLTANEIKALAGNAAGMERAGWKNKITVVSAPFYQAPGEETKSPAQQAAQKIPLYAIILGVVGLLLLLITIFVIIRRRRKAMAEEIEEDEEEGIEEELAAVQEIDDLIQKPEIMNLQNEKSRQLREHIRDFTEQNPEISAQMLKNWLNGGGEQNNGGANS